MNNLNTMIAAASGAIEYIFTPAAKDRVLILTDSFSLSIAEAFKQASLKIGCSVETFEIDDTQRPLKEIPLKLESLLRGKTIVLNIIKAFPEEIAFRIKWIFKVEEKISTATVGTYITRLRIIFNCKTTKSTRV